jgi:hypothetical protein
VHVRYALNARKPGSLTLALGQLYPEIAILPLTPCEWQTACHAANVRESLRDSILIGVREIHSAPPLSAERAAGILFADWGSSARRK